MVSIQPAFSFQLENKIEIGKIVLAKFDGIKPSLAAVTSGGRVLIHSPHDQSTPSAIRFLNFNRKISAITAGSLGSDAGGLMCDVLLIGTESTLSAYDVERNSDLFTTEVQDGVNTMIIGRLGDASHSLVYVGGNCSILGYDMNGEESYWTVTSDNVCSIAIHDYNDDGKYELLAGSEDFELRVFKNENIIKEISEADRIIFIVPMNQKMFAYALANGSVGVYEGKKRLWRVKGKHQVKCSYSVV